MYGFGHCEGMSSRAIHSGGTSHPHDPADLVRCIRERQHLGLSVDDLRARMSGRSTAWDRLLAGWEGLESLLAEEYSTGWATLTYKRMKTLLANGVTCEACSGTGQGEACPKCKGSGRRSGGCCRATDCRRGYHDCDACRGYGYTGGERW